MQSYGCLAGRDADWVGLGNLKVGSRFSIRSRCAIERVGDAIVSLPATPGHTVTIPRAHKSRRIPFGPDATYSQTLALVSVRSPWQPRGQGHVRAARFAQRVPLLGEGPWPDQSPCASQP